MDQQPTDSTANDKHKRALSVATTIVVFAAITVTIIEGALWIIGLWQFTQAFPPDRTTALIIYGGIGLFLALPLGASAIIHRFPRTASILFFVASALLAIRMLAVGSSPYLYVIPCIYVLASAVAVWRARVSAPRHYSDQETDRT